MPSQHTLNVSLTPELIAYVAGLVASGRYRSSSEVLRAALRLLQHDEPIPATPEPSSPGARQRRSKAADK